MKKKPFARPPKFKNRLILMICGVITQALGLSLLIQLDMGTDPCALLSLGIANYVPLSFGTILLLSHMITFVIVVRYDLSMIGFGTIGNMVFLGYISDFFTFLWGKILPGGTEFFTIPAIRYGLVVPALAIFVIGVALYLTAGLGASPYDSLPFIIHASQKRYSFKVIRMMWDIGFMVIGTILGGPIGIITVGVAFFLGPVISYVQKKLEFMIS